MPTTPAAADRPAARGPSSDLQSLPLQPLFGGRDLARWVREGGAPRRHVGAHALRWWWHALWFEQNWRTQTPRLARLAPPADPVFIVGLWRSGTTALHELLAASTGWLTPRTWQCFSPSTCFLTSAPTDQSVTERPMDRGQIATHGPQEDEFALLLLGEPSLYRGFLDPRRLRDCARLDWALHAPASTAAPAPVLPRWQAFVRGIAAQDPQRRLLLKSPNHSFRLPLLQDLFPRARFVWIGRHTGELLASNVKMWRVMMGRYALWDCPPGVLEEFLQEALQAAAQALSRCLDEMPRERLLWVDFEELRGDPRSTLERVLDFLGTAPLTRAQVRSGVELALARVPVHPGGRADMPDAPAVQQLERLAAAARLRFGGLPPARGGAAVARPGAAR